MNTNLKDIAANLNDSKLVANTQVDLLYLNNLAAQVFNDPKIYASIQSDAGFINQVAGQLFNYFSNPNPITEKIWYVALASGLAQSIIDANNLISKIPHGNPKREDLIAVLNIFIADCKAIEKIIPINE